MSARRIAIATGFSIAVYGMEATMLGTLLPGFSKTLTPSQSGTIAAAQSLGLITGALFSGPVVDRTGAKSGIVVGLLLIAASLLFLPSAHGYLPILLAMSGLGLGGGIISTGSNTMASLIGGANPSGTLNLLNVFFGVGGLTTPALGATFDPPAMCRIVVALATVALLLVLTAAAPTAAAHSRGEPADRRALLQPIFPLLCLFLGLYVAAEVGVWNWLAAYLTTRDVPQATALRLLSFGFATGIIVGRLIAARITMRMDPMRVTLVSSVLMTISTTVVLTARGITPIAISVFCAGLAMAPVYPSTLGTIGITFPRGRATAIGIAFTTGALGVAASSKLIGAIAGNDPKNLGTALFVIPAMSGAMIVVNILVRSLRKTA